MSTQRDHDQGRCKLHEPHEHYPIWVARREAMVRWLLREFHRPGRPVQRAA